MSHMALATQNWLATVLAIAMAGLSNDAARPAADKDDGDVRATIQQYFNGHATGDPSEMRKPFLPSAHIEGIRDGSFVSWTLDEYCARFSGRPAADESSRRRSIDVVEISGDAASVKATLIHGPTVFTDFLLLVKVDGAWKIANKVYTSHPVSQR